MTSTTTVASAAATTATERQTYWCHECDMSVSLLSTTTTSSLLCPHCHSDFLEQMDNPNPSPDPNSNPNVDLSPFPSFFLSPQPTPTAVAADDDDNYLLDSPFLHRLIQHLTNPESTTAPSKSAIESIPTIEITASLLDLDPISLCAVCKDQFVIGVEAKQLPCKHMYHSECILPWLSQRNSCPVCRFRLPTESDDSREGMSSRFVAELMEGEGLLGFESTLRHIARRHGVVYPDWRENSVGESYEGGFGVGGGVGDGDIGVSARVSDEEDSLMS
ncbi:E3 ubiquitin-protein ligase RING1-like [Actinidia eriantha]|uniref:E3 ubiquitin-protein ligase RING1-like n=1 Tax=Actinidia eriantha TaxID=165200 RepID=UPI00258F87C7|nr:E3 ubiquitin-protein ligase RING1-like [Actinidia eriantha]